MEIGSEGGRSGDVLAVGNSKVNRSGHLKEMRIHKYSFFSPTSPEWRIPIPYGYQEECLTLTPFCLAGSSANRNERWGTRSWAMIGIVFPPSWGCDAKVLGLVSTFHSS